VTKPLPFTEAMIRRAISAARKKGLRVTGIRPDGIVLVQDGDDSTPALPSINAAGETAPVSSGWEDQEA